MGITVPQEQFEKAETAIVIQEILEKIIGNKEQVKVMLLVSKDYSYKDIIEETSYTSNGACRNAFLKGKKKLTAYILKYPDAGKRLKNLLMGK